MSVQDRLVTARWERACVPAVGNIVSSVPALGNIVSSVPALGNIVSSVPAVGNIVSSVPAVGNIVSSAPAVGNIVSSVPAEGNIVSKRLSSGKDRIQCPGSGKDRIQRLRERERSYVASQQWKEALSLASHVNPRVTTQQPWKRYRCTTDRRKSRRGVSTHPRRRGPWGSIGTWRRITWDSRRKV